MTTSISASLWAYPKYIKDFLLPFQTLRGKEASCRGLALENWGIVWSLFVIHPLWCLLRCIVLLLSFNNLLIYRYHSWSLPYSSIKPPEVWRPHEIILVLSSHLGSSLVLDVSRICFPDCCLCCFHGTSMVWIVHMTFNCGSLLWHNISWLPWATSELLPEFGW